MRSIEIDRIDERDDHGMKSLAILGNQSSPRLDRHGTAA